MSGPGFIHLMSILPIAFLRTIKGEDKYKSPQTTGMGMIDQTGKAKPPTVTIADQSNHNRGP